MNQVEKIFRITVGIFFSLNFALFWAIPIMVQVHSIDLILFSTILLHRVSSGSIVCVEF
jgi:hypothetical protein